MERPSRRASTIAFKWRRLILVVSYILCNANASFAQDSSNPFADVRSARIPLRKASDAATDAVSGNTGSDVASTVPYGNDKNNRVLFVLQYNEANVWQLRTALVEGGADVLEYVADNTLLVQAKPNIIGMADRFGALAAVFKPSFKVAPEAAAVFAAAAATASASAAKLQRPAQGRRRDRQLAAPAAGGSPLFSGARGASAGLNDDDVNASTSSVTAASGLGPLASLSTWRGYQQASQPEDAPSQQPPASVKEKSPPPSSSSSGGGGSSISSTGTAASFEQDMYGASVRLVPGLSAGARDAIAKAWPAALAAALGLATAGQPCRPRALTDGLYNDMSPILVVYFCPKDYEPGVTWLSKMGTVLWIEPALKATVRNAIAGWILQTGNMTMTQYGNPTATLRPYWGANLQGQGIVVGLDDTGIDMDHCSFIDDRYRQGSLRAMFVGSPPRLYLPDHRKIVQYMLPISSGINRWFGDDPYGHGTHTAGSVAGAAFSNSSALGLINQRSTGSAPQARLSFFDLAPVGGNLYLPQPLDDKVLSYHYAVGARITSSSWGFTGAIAVTYNDVCRQYDSFAWRNPDFLSVMAAGNDGDNSNMPTVTAPATAKNILSVGATVNHPRDFPASQYNLAILFRYTDANGTMQSQSMYPYRGTSEFTWRAMLNSKQVPFSVASPLNACANLTGNYTGMIVLVDLFGTNSTCTADVRAGNARAAGGLAVVFIASTSDFVDGAVQVPVISDNRITWGMITRPQGLAVASLLTNTSRNITKPHMTFLTYPDINLGIDSVTWFSSYGPLPDGRFKPDIVAPGGPVESSASLGGIGTDTNGATCSGATVQYQGTSMATPLVAGHLALVRQYLRDGFYPSGVPSDQAAVGFEPSGMLLKAAAVAGATSLTGGFAANLGAPLGVAPDGYQGWGRLDLSKTLPLPGQSHPFFRISVADFGVIDQSQWIYLSGIEATGTGPIVAALVWHDYPGSGAAKKGLINDLDFGYQINTSTISRTRTDSVNNVERIELRNLNAGDRLTFSVFGKSIRHKLFTTTDAQLPQRWAVLVAGHFNGTLKTPLNPAYSRPQRFVAATQITIRATNGCVTVGTNDTILTNGACNITKSFFTLVEEPAPPAPTDAATAGPQLVSDTGYLYSIRDSLGRCLMLPDGVFGNRVVLVACNATNQFQKFGLYKSPYVQGSYYQVVVSSAIRAVAASAGRCLKQTAISALLLWSCDDDDATQLFELRGAVAGQAGRSISPSPPPPSPSPQAPAQQWYPYSLTFRVDWYPVGVSNFNDYDYQAGHNGYGDDSNGPSLDDLDIIVAWSWNGTSYTLGPNADNNTVAITGALYGGDNKDYGTQYEIVYFQQTIMPPPTAFYVCVVWKYTQTPAVRVAMTIFKGYAIFTASKLFNTSVNADYSCSPSAGGFVGTYNPTSPPSPPVPPSPPSPPPVPFPLMFRTDWTIVSGMRGRSTKPLNLDIVVSWAVGTDTFAVGSTSYTAGGALYGGDNLRNNGSNFETVYWPVGTSLPPTNTFHVCIRWSGNPKPIVQVTLSVFQSGRPTTSSAMIDTTFDWSDACVPGAIGYVDSYWVRGPMGLPTDASYSTCAAPPAPSVAFSLYFLASWAPANLTAGVPPLIDWDLVVSWRSGGVSYELSPYSRFATGAVHAGDNMRLVSLGNKEAVYWPTGLTGVEPNPAQYDVCVRFYAAGRLNVTLTTYRYNTLVMTVNRTLDAGAINSKTCTPQSSGYLGSYNFTSSSVTGIPTGFVGRRALELPGGEDGVEALAAAGLLDPEQLAALLPSTFD